MVHSGGQLANSIFRETKIVCKRKTYFGVESSINSCDNKKKLGYTVGVGLSKRLLFNPRKVEKIVVCPVSSTGFIFLLLVILVGLSILLGYQRRINRGKRK